MSFRKKSQKSPPTFYAGNVAEDSGLSESHLRIYSAGTRSVNPVISKISMIYSFT
jgi:hypothetical protein